MKTNMVNQLPGTRIKLHLFVNQFYLNRHKLMQLIHRRSQGDQRGHGPPEFYVKLQNSIKKNININFFAPLQVFSSLLLTFSKPVGRA